MRVGWSWNEPAPAPAPGVWPGGSGSTHGRNFNRRLAASTFMMLKMSYLTAVQHNIAHPVINAHSAPPDGNCQPIRQPRMSWRQPHDILWPAEFSKAISTFVRPGYVSRDLLPSNHALCFPVLAFPSPPPFLLYALYYAPLTANLHALRAMYSVKTKTAPFADDSPPLP